MTRPPALSLTLAAGVPLHRALYDALRGAMLAGRLAPLATLPSTRELSAELRIARGTVVAVFEQLKEEGYLTGRRGSGTVVASRLPDAAFIATSAGATATGFIATGGAAAARAPVPPPMALSRWGRALRGTPFPSTGRPTARPFRPHVPALDAFPFELWGRSVARRARADETLALGDPDPRGHLALREALADHLRVARAVPATADRLVIVSGTQQALDLVTRLTIDRGDEVWLEEPGYVGARAVLEAREARVVPVPVDGDGMDVAAGVRRAPRARLAYVTPAHHAPTGATMPLARRLALLEWARRAGAWLFEDDYDSEFRFSGRPVPALKSLDHDDRVIHAGSFSKTLLPSLRLGYMVVPERLLSRAIAARSIVDRYPPPLAQAALADFIQAGHFGRHLRRMRVLYAERRQALLEALAAELGGAVSVGGASAGLDLLVTLPLGVDDRALAAALGAAGIESRALSGSALARPRRGGLLLGYAAFSPARIRAAMKVLARAAEPFLRRAAGARPGGRSRRAAPPAASVSVGARDRSS